MLKSSSISKSSIFLKKLPLLEFEDSLAEILYFIFIWPICKAANKSYIKRPSDIIPIC